LVNLLLEPLRGTAKCLGSQSLRRIELDERREIGGIVTDGLAVKQMHIVFEEDWAQTDSGRRAASAAARASEEQVTADSGSQIASVS
jgi:hypothetical protein